MSKTVTVSKSNVALAIGVLGVLVLIGSEAFAAEPASKRKTGPGTATQAVPARSMDRSHRLNRAPATQTAWRKVDGLKYEAEIVDNARRAGDLAAASSQSTAYEGKTVATYNFFNAWPSKVAPAPQVAANPPSLSSGRSTAVSAETLEIPHAGFLTETRAPLATESVIIVSEQIQRVSASAGSGARDGNTIHASNQWVPQTEARKPIGVLGDLNEFQQAEIDR